FVLNQSIVYANTTSYPINHTLNITNNLSSNSFIVRQYNTFPSHIMQDSHYNQSVASENNARLLSISFINNTLYLLSWSLEGVYQTDLSYNPAGQDPYVSNFLRLHRSEERRVGK